MKQENNKAPLMSWTTKTIAASPKSILKTEIQITIGFFLIFLYVAWLAYEKLDDSMAVSISTGATLLAFAIYVIVVGVRQKTIYKYIVNEDKGFIEYYLHYPDFANGLFKSIAILAILLFIGTAIFTGSLFFLIGPIAIAAGSARFLLFWKNEIHTRNGTSWGDYNFVTIDYDRLMVVTHCTDQTIGFEARFPDKNLLEDYLLLLKKLLPESATYTKKKWEW